MVLPLLIVVAILLSFVLVTQWTVFYQLLRQQGRLLLRLDSIERSLEVALLAGQLSPAAVLGLEVGAEIPSFHVPDLDGRPVSWEAFRGHPALLVHWSPACGFCELIAPDLAQFQGDFGKRGGALILLSHGDAGPNRALAAEYHLNCPILLLNEALEPVKLFEQLGTPAAYFLDAEGKVGMPLAVGADQVLALFGQAVDQGNGRKRLPGERPLGESRIERNGLRAGTPAPPFALPDLSGGTVSLEAYHGRRVLLVFTDPHCSPCDQLVPRLAQLRRERRDDPLSVVMVGRGDPEENRRKAVQLGIDFPLALQRSWEVSRQYGIFDTPVAFLISEEGVIVSNVARGVDEILALALRGPGADREAEDGRVLR